MSTSTRLARRVAKHVGIPVADIPTFLCPGIIRTACLRSIRVQQTKQPPFSPASQRRQISSATPSTHGPLPATQFLTLNKLPQQCTGCGALSQTVDSDGPGFYTLTRKSVRSFVEGPSGPKLSAEDQVVKAANESVGSDVPDIDIGAFSASGK